MSKEQVIWAEKYRPRSVQECILPSYLKKIFQGIVSTGEVPNLLLSGVSGTGKTTVARAVCEELDLDYILINASMGGDESGISALRDRIRAFASAMSFGGKRKIVILDEADRLGINVQEALRGFMDEFAANCGFIFTCNQKGKVHPALHSRCSVKEFRIPKEEKKDIISDIYRMCCGILTKENVKYDGKVLAELVVRYFPDSRRLLNELQAFSKNNNEINEGILTAYVDIHVDKLMKAMKEKNFQDVRAWVVDSVDADPSKVYRKIYDSLKDALKKESIPQAIIYLADYQYKAAFSADPEICLLACVIQLMADCEFV